MFGGRAYDTRARTNRNAHPIAAKPMVTMPMHSSCTPVPTITQNSMGYFEGGRKMSAWTSYSYISERTTENKITE